jgi:hypothetical protein
MTLSRVLSLLNPFEPDPVERAIRAGLWTEGEQDRQKMSHREDQWRENGTV